MVPGRGLRSAAYGGAAASLEVEGWGKNEEEGREGCCRILGADREGAIWGEGEEEQEGGGGKGDDAPEAVDGEGGG